MNKVISNIRKAAFTAAFFVLTLSILSYDASARKVTPRSPVRMEAVKNSDGRGEMPDFAFPKTVEKNAGSGLSLALKNGKFPDALSEMVKLIIARRLVSADSRVSSMNLCDSVGALMPQPYRSIASLIQAQMLAEMYADDSWTFRQRTLPTDSVPADPALWSADIFSEKILSLVKESSEGYEIAAKIPISDISVILQNWKGAAEAGMSLEMYMMMTGTRCLEPFLNNGFYSSVIPFFSSFNEKGVPALYPSLLERIYSFARNADDMLRSLLDCWLIEKGNSQGKDMTPFILSEVDAVDKPSPKMQLFYQLFNNSSLSNAPVLSDEDSEDGVKCMPSSEERLFGYSFPIRDLPSPQSFYTCVEQLPSEYLDKDAAKLKRGVLSSLSKRWAKLDYAPQYLPGDSIQLTLQVANMSTPEIRVFKTEDKYYHPENRLSLKIKDFANVKPVLTKGLHFSGAVPFADRMSFNLPSLSPGVYSVIVTPDRKGIQSLSAEERDATPYIILVSDLSIQLLSLSDSDEKSKERQLIVSVCDGRDGVPVKGAKIDLSLSGRGVTKDIAAPKLEATDIEGLSQLSLPDFEDLRIRTTARKDESLARDVYYLWGRQTSSNTLPKANIFTDLSLYHPGDTIGFAAVIYSVDPSSHQAKLLPEKRVKVILRNAAHEEVDTLYLATDANGRFSSEFLIPKDGMLGSWSISICEETDLLGRAPFLGNQSVEVAEYKAPSFLVDLSKSDSAIPLDEEAVFYGKVVSYSGMPLQGCKVTYKVDYTPFRYYRGGRSASYNGVVDCSADGQFVISLPTKNLKGTRFEYGSFSLTATAVAETGETQESASLYFSLGSGLRVAPSIPDVYKAEGESLRFNVPVYDAMGRPVTQDVEYEVRNLAGEIIACGVFVSPSLDIDSSLLSSGKYIFKFHIKSEKMECASNGDSSVSVIIWRMEDKRPPVDTPLWLPIGQVSGKPGHKVSFPVGSSYPSGSLLCLISGTNGVNKVTRVQTAGKNINFEVEVPAADQRMLVTFFGMHDLNGESRTVTVIPDSQLEEMEITASSFRDRIVPGTREKWSFKVNVGKNVASGVPAFAVMSDKSLDAIAPFRWNFSVYKGGWTYPSETYFPVIRKLQGYQSWSKVYYPDVAVLYPELNTYNYRLAINRSGYGAATDFMVVKECSMVDEMSVDGAVAGNGVMLRSEKKVYASALKMSKQEAAETESEADDAISYITGSVSDFPTFSEDIPLRAMEMPLAFFRTDLISDEEGRLMLDFDVPDYNTTWKLQLCGYDPQLHSAVVSFDAVAAKRVMVNSNVPSYVRIGDVVSLTATLFNNGADPLPVGGRIEVFNPLDGSVIVSREFSPVALDASGSRTIQMELKVPAEYSVIGVRCYALGGGFSDGEQGLIPVLAASSPVVEATPFFLSPGQSDFSMRLPKFKDDAFVSLQYCDNPIWYCTTALPSLMDVDSKCATLLSRTLFGGALAEGLVNRYPEISRALTEITSEEATKDSILISNLNKNPQLKIIALEATPWQSNAEAETLRMSRLEDLLDRQSNENLKNLLVGKLEALQTNGGWKWTEGSQRPARFVTERVLQDFSLMRQSGVVDFDSRMSALCSRAMKWVEQDIVEEYEKYRKNKDAFPYSSLMDYLFIRSGLTDRLPSGKFATLSNKAIDAICKEWKNYSVSAKATAALVLSRAGRTKEAMVILESLSQYSSSSPEKGVWFDNNASGRGSLFVAARVLKAFSELTPSSPLIDGLRQWLILSRQTVDWGKDPYTAEVISAVMTSGADWTSDPAAFAVVKIDGKEIDMPRSVATGEFTISLDAKNVSGKKLDIERFGSSQAWGGVVARFIQPMQDVKPTSVPDLSVKKEIVRIGVAEDGSQTVGGALKVGDRVRITLTIRCGKNMEYVAVTDERPACLRPVEQLSGYTVSDGVGFYREVKSAGTNLFIEYLPKGDFVISYECFVERPGEYSNGITTVQSQYSPVFTAHSAGSLLVIPSE